MYDTSVVEFQALSSDVGGLAAGDVDVQFLPSECDRPREPWLEASIAATWEQRLGSNPRLFDGSKFRLHQLLHTSSRPVFRLGLTSYRDYLGTNCSERVDEIRRKGLLAHGDSQAFMADPLGVGALLLTSDDKLVLLRRSHLCGEAQGLLDGPGGHPEPEKVSGIFDGLNYVDPELVVKEIFESIVNEVVDEVNVPRCKLSEPRLMGIIKNNTTGGRKSAQFIIRCQMSSSEIRDSFNLETQSEAYESTAILFYTENELLTASPPPHDFTPQMRGCLSLYFYLKNKSKQ